MDTERALLQAATDDQVGAPCNECHGSWAPMGIFESRMRPLGLVNLFPFKVLSGAHWPRRSYARLEICTNIEIIGFIFQ